MKLAVILHLKVVIPNTSLLAAARGDLDQTPRHPSPIEIIMTGSKSQKSNRKQIVLASELKDFQNRSFR